MILLVLVGLVALVYLLQTGEFRRFLIREIETRTNLKIRAGEAELRFGKVMGVAIRDIVLHGASGSKPLLIAEGMLVRVALRPLLDRKIVFDEIRFQRPEIKIARGLDGDISMSELLAVLPFQKAGDDQFALDIKQIMFEKGVLYYHDLRGQGRRIGIVLRDVDLKLRRVRGWENSRSGSQNPVDRFTVDYGLVATILSGGKQVGLASEGRISFPQGGYELRKARFDSKIDVDTIPLDLLESYYGTLGPLTGLKGSMSPRLRWVGSLEEGGKVAGAVALQQLEVISSGESDGSKAVGGELQVDIDLSRDRVRFRRLDLRTEDANLFAQGTLSSPDGRSPYLEIHLMTPFLSLGALREYVPKKAMGSPAWGNLLKAVSQGEARLIRGGVAGRLSELEHLFQPGYEKHFWMEVEVRAGRVDLQEGWFPPIDGIGGRILLQDGVLIFRGFKGNTGGVSFEEIEGSQEDLFSGRTLLRVRGRGEALIKPLWEQLKGGAPPVELEKVGIPLGELSGKGKSTFSWQTDFASPSNDKGRITLGDVNLQLGDGSLSEIKGDLLFLRTRLKAERISAPLGKFPVGIRFILSDYWSGRTSFDLTVASPGIGAGEIARWLPLDGALVDSGLVRGKLRYRRSMEADAERTLSGLLELVGIRMQFSFMVHPLSKISGKLRFHRQGIGLEKFQGQVGRYGFRFAGKWSYQEKPQLTFSFHSPEMDFAQILPRERNEFDDWYDRLQAKGTVEVGKGKFENFAFTDIKTDLVIDQRLWTAEKFFARSRGGIVRGKVSVLDHVEAVSYSVEPEIEGVPVEEVLSWFDGGTKEIKGKVHLSGSFKSSGRTADEREKNLDGAFRFHVKNGTLRRFRILARTLNLMDLSSWFSLKMPDISQEGIRFHRVSGDVKISQGVYSTEDLLMDGDVLRITGSGRLNGVKREMNFIIALRPFPKVDSAINTVPLIGRGLAGIKNTLLVTGFRVKGPVENPTITSTSLSTLSDFFCKTLAVPKGLIDLQGHKKK